MKYEPKISVIIPVYNVEQYLKQCLDSVINQTLKDIEIICINDCSTDNSLEILNEYAKNDSRIKVINLEQNSGVSVARNRGIDEAQGEYLGFVDSDDYIDLDFYEKLYNKAKETSAEVVKTSVKQGKEGSCNICSNLNSKILENKYNFFVEFYSAIYKRRFILDNEIYFPQKVLTFEDPVFSIQVICKVQKLELLDTSYYYHVQRTNSKTSTFTQNQQKSFMLGIENIFDILNESAVPQNSYIIICNDLLLSNLWRRCKKVNLDDKIKEQLFEKFKTVFKNKSKYKDETITKVAFKTSYNDFLKAENIKTFKSLRERFKNG